MPNMQVLRICLAAFLCVLTLPATGCAGRNAGELSPLDWAPLSRQHPPQSAWPEFPTTAFPAEGLPADALKQAATTQVLTGDAYHSCHAAAIADSEAHSLTLDAAATPCCWGIYRFTGIPDIANHIAMRLELGSNARTHCWIGLADFQAETWRWTRAMGYSTIRPLIPPAFYANAAAEVYIAIATEQGVSLEVLSLSLDVGTPPQLICSIPNGTNVPVELTLDASASYDPDGGDIVDFAWDWENDGTFASSGTDPIASKLCTAAGHMRVGARVTDEEGSSAYDYFDLELTGWQNYFCNIPLWPEARTLLTRANGRLIVVGRLFSHYRKYLVFLELLPDGTVFSNSAIETEDYTTDFSATLDESGNLYVCMGLEESTLEILKLDPEWHLEWAASWRLKAVVRPKWQHVEIQLDNAGNLLVYGHYLGDGSVHFFIKMDSDGNPIISREYKLACLAGNVLAGSVIGSVATSWNETVIVGSGSERNEQTNEYYRFAFLIKLDSGGNPVASRRFAPFVDGVYQQAFGIAIDDEDRIYINGEQADESFLMQCDSSGAGASCVSWAEPENEQTMFSTMVCDVKADKLYVCSHVNIAEQIRDIVIHQLSTEGILLRSARLHGSESTWIASMLDDNNGSVFLLGSSYYDTKLWLPAHSESYPVDLETVDLEISEPESSLAMNPNWWIFDHWDYTINNVAEDGNQIFIGMACVDNWPPVE